MSTEKEKILEVLHGDYKRLEANMKIEANEKYKIYTMAIMGYINDLIKRLEKNINS